MEDQRSPRRRRSAQASSVNSTSRNSNRSADSGASASSRSLVVVQPAQRRSSRASARRRSASGQSDDVRSSHGAERLHSNENNNNSSWPGSSAPSPSSQRDFDTARPRGSTRLSVLSRQSSDNGGGGVARGDYGSVLSQAMYRSTSRRLSTAAPSASGASASWAGSSRRDGSQSCEASDADGHGASAASFSTASISTCASTSARAAALLRGRGSPNQHPHRQRSAHRRTQSSSGRWGHSGDGGDNSFDHLSRGMRSHSHSRSTSAEYTNSISNGGAAPVALRLATPRTVDAETQRRAWRQRAHSSSASTAATTASPQATTPLSASSGVPPRSRRGSSSASHEAAATRRRRGRRGHERVETPFPPSSWASSARAPASRKKGRQTASRSTSSSGSESRRIGGPRRSGWRGRSLERAASIPLATVAAAAAAAAAAQRSSGGPQSRRPVMAWRSRARVCAVASVPTGELFTGGDPAGVIEVWDSRIGRRLCGLSGHQATVLSLLALPDSSLLLSGSADHTARLWDMRTLQNIMVLEGHRGLITTLATLWMPDVGLNLFTGSDDGTVRQWRALTGVCVHVYRGHHGPVNVVVSLRPAKYIATGGGDGFFKVWNAQTLRCLCSVAAVPSHAAATAAAAGVRESGHPVGRERADAGGEDLDDGTGVSGVGGGAAVWDIAQLGDTNQSLATATNDGVVRLWATQWSQHTVLLKEIYNPDMLLKGRSGARCLLACGAHLFVGGARGELYVWDTESIPCMGEGSSGARRPHGTQASLGPYAADPSAATTAATAHNTATSATASTTTSTTAITTTTSGGGGVDGVETYGATFLFHTAAVTGLTRQGARLCSVSLDHMMCRWDLRELVPLTSGDNDPRALPQSAGVGGDEGMSSVWAQPWSLAGGPAAAFAGHDGGGGGGGAVMGTLTSSPAGVEGLDKTGQAVLNPEARLHHDEALSDQAASELSEEETATLYTELPLSFVVRRLRSAATTPVDARSVLRAVLTAAFTVFLTLFFALGLAPVSLHSIDVAATTFALTANHPLPSFALPHTFRSITNVKDFAAWVRLFCDQLRYTQAPVQLELSPASAATAAPAATTASHEEDADSSHLVDVAAMPGGVVLLNWIRMRVRQVHNHSCKWNRHFLRTTNGTTAGVAKKKTRPCYGLLTAATEATAPLCVNFTGIAFEGLPLVVNESEMVTGCVLYHTSGAGISFSGMAGEYNSAGYVVDLPIRVITGDSASVDAAMEALSQIQSTLFDPLRTRLIDVLLYGYHIHSHTLARLHYTLELPVSGAWLATTDMRSFSRYNSEENSSAYVTLVCVVMLLVLLLVMLACLVDEALAAYYVGKLVDFMLSATVLLEVATMITGFVSVGLAFRWIARSRSPEMTSLLQVVTSATTSRTYDIVWRATTPTVPSLTAPRGVQTLVEQLNSVELAFRELSNATALLSVLFFVQVMVLCSRWLPFLQTMRVVFQEIRIPLAVGLVSLLLGVVGVSIAVRCLFGTTYWSFRTIEHAFVQVLLYVGGLITLTDGIAPPLWRDREVIGRLVIIIIDYIVRGLFYAYMVAIISERYEAVSRTTPNIPPRVLLAKWWSDLKQQIALMRQRTFLKPTTTAAAAAGATTTTAAAARSTRDASPSVVPESSAKATPATASLDDAGDTTADPATSLGNSIHSDLLSGSGDTQAGAAAGVGGGGDGGGAAAPRTALGMGQHLGVLMDHLWRGLQLLQREYERAQRPQQQQQWDSSRSTTSGGTQQSRDSLSGRQGASRRGGRSWSGRRSHEGSIGSTSTDRNVDDHHLTASAELTSSPSLITVLASRREDGGRCEGGGHGPARAPTQRESRDSTFITYNGTFSAAFPVPLLPTEGVAGRAGEGATGAAALVEPRVRQMDLLLLVPEAARTPFARGVIRLTWNTLTWMYHYEQLHHRAQNPAEEERRRRLEDGIQRVQQRLTPLYAVVRRTQARMADHEARLRPLAKAVAAVSGDAR